MTSSRVRKKGISNSKISRLRQFNRDAGKAFVEAVRDEIHLLATRPQKLARFLLETVLVSLIAFGLFLYFDPALNLIPAPLNLIVFAFVVLIYLYVHFIVHLPTDYVQHYR